MTTGDPNHRMPSESGGGRAARCCPAGGPWAKPPPLNELARLCRASQLMMLKRASGQRSENEESEDCPVAYRPNHSLEHQ